MTIEQKLTAKDESPEDILEQIKNITLYGRADINRGTPKGIEIVDIVEYETEEGEKNRDQIRRREQVEDTFWHQHYNIKNYKLIGKRYWISTTNENTSMHDSVTGITTSFEYTHLYDDKETLWHDAIPIASTPFFKWETEVKKIPENKQSFRKIIQAINPYSKLL